MNAVIKILKHNPALRSILLSTENFAHSDTSYHDNRLQLKLFGPKKVLLVQYKSVIALSDKARNRLKGEF